MPSVHGRNERKRIILNEYNQPVGPTNEVVKELGSFLGTLGRSVTFCPLNVFNWRKLGIKDDMWKYIKEKYDIPDEAKTWVFDSICAAWRKYKNQLKRKHKAYQNVELRMENRPVDIPESHFEELLNYWNSNPHKKMSETNTINRNKLKCPHTAGRTPFAVIREAKKKEMSDTSDTLSSKDIFGDTRKRKLDRVYQSSYDNTISKIAEMERLQLTQETEDGSHSVDAFASVMGPEHPGRVRLYGRGVTKAVLKGKIGNLGSSSDAADERMQQKMEEMEERMQQRMLEKLNEQKDAMEQHITMNVVARLQHLDPQLRLGADMLRFVEASSAQQVAVQLNNRPSAGCNNLGGANQEIREDDESEELDLI